eukprot:16315404-Heterocapsa_arctica.AAC.1
MLSRSSTIVNNYVCSGTTNQLYVTLPVRNKNYPIPYSERTDENHNGKEVAEDGVNSSGKG